MRTGHKLGRVVALLILIAAPTARADDDDAAKARSLYEKGMAHFQLREYDAAIEKWEAGFRLKPVPEFIYNIAQAYRLSKRPEKAVQFYRTYLRLAPSAPNRAEVDDHIAALTRLIDEQQKSATAPPEDAVPPGGRPATPAPAPAATLSPAPAATAAQLTATPPPRREPITKKKWFWPVVAGGAAVVVAAVVVGVVLGTRSSDSAQSLPPLRF